MSDLAAYGLAQCTQCGRILCSHHLRQEGHCRDAVDCILARQLAWMARSGFQPTAGMWRELAEMEEDDA